MCFSAPISPAELHLMGVKVTGHTGQAKLQVKKPQNNVYTLLCYIVSAYRTVILFLFVLGAEGIKVIVYFS